MNEELIQKTEEVQASRPWVKYLVTAGIGLLAVLLVLLSRGFFKDGVTAADRIMLLSDAFFTVGILIACFGGLMYVSGEGVFDGLTYAFFSLTWFFNVKKKRESYADYKARKHGGKKKSFLYLIIVGVLFVGIGGIFNWIFLSNYT